jgi:diadenosine tetraphosphate (Ap4A) HIT family hydrolase
MRGLPPMDCVFCNGEGGPLLWRDDCCRVVRASSGDYPGFLRVVLNRHVREMTDLDESERRRMMRAVWAAESAVRELFRPEKVNLASFGNQAPHLHWHVIARYTDDPHFPDPAWGTPRRAGQVGRPDVTDDQLRANLAARLG